MSVPDRDPYRFDTRAVHKAAKVSGAVVVVGAVVLSVLERQFAPPGIVRLQLAGGPEAAQTILETWGAAGRSAATAHVWIDFAWLLGYGVFGVAVLELIRRRSAPGSWWARAGRYARWAPAVAVLFDLTEGIGHLVVLASWESPEPWAVTMTRTAASAKWILLGVSVVWGAVAAVAARRARRRTG